MLDIENCANVGGSVASEALVSPAKRMRSEDHIVEFENGIISVWRLLFEHIKPSGGDPASRKGPGQRLLIDDRSSSGVDEIGRRFHQGEPVGVNEMAGFWGQRTAHADKGGTQKHVFQANEFDSKLGGELRVREGIVRDQLHVEGLDQAEE